jgi:transcriptional regulator with XRE-family HTH domain
MMRSFWWSSYGNFEADESGLYPRASCVVAHYRRLSGLSRETVASRLGIGPRALAYAEQEGRGLDSVARLRELRVLLDIPPALLGLCDAPGPAGWWLAEYEPWLSGSDDWPDGGAVIKTYRRAKDWTQSDLAESLGITLLAVQNMENSGSSFDSLSRRRALRFLLAIPPALLGLDSEHMTKEFGGSLIGSAQGPAPELITSFRASVDALFSGYFSGHAQDRVPDTLAWLSEAREIRGMTKGNQRLQMLEVESLGYQALANIEREHATDAVVFEYSNKAVKLARDSGNADLLSAALCRRAETAFLRGYVDLSQRSMDEALPLPVQGEAEQLARAAIASPILASGSSDEQDRSSVLALIDQARPALDIPDPFYRRCDREAVVIGQSWALNQLALHAPQLQARDLLRRSSDLLIDLSPKTARRAVRAKLALAQAYVSLGELDYAATFAVEVLPLIDEIKSMLYLPQLGQIYASLHKSKLRHDPRVARIGLYLQGHGVF